MTLYGFTNKTNGDMRDNKRLIEYIKIQNPDVLTVVRPRQVHGDTIAVYEESPHKDNPTYSIADTDGVLTRKKNVALTIITADCVPIVYFDDNYKMIGASHQGWKGMLKRLPEKMIARMEELGSKKEDITVSMGPAINSCCYEIQEDRAIMFRNEFPQSNAIINNGNHFFLNLVHLAYEQLIDAGIKPANIRRKIQCTSCQEDVYYSFRKARNKVDFEEQAAYILQQ